MWAPHRSGFSLKPVNEDKVYLLLFNYSILSPSVALHETKTPYAKKKS